MQNHVFEEENAHKKECIYAHIWYDHEHINSELKYAVCVHIRKYAS
jgi:hypothetical protein